MFNIFFIYLSNGKMEVTLYYGPHAAYFNGQNEQSSTKQIITPIVDVSPLCPS